MSLDKENKMCTDYKMPYLIDESEHKGPKIKKRSAYKSYVASFTEENTEHIPGFDGLQLLQDFIPHVQSSLKKHHGLKIHISATGLYRKGIDTKDNEGKLSIALGLMKDWNKVPDDQLTGFWHTSNILQILDESTITPTLKQLGDSYHTGTIGLDHHRRHIPIGIASNGHDRLFA